MLYYCDVLGRGDGARRPGGGAGGDSGPEGGERTRSNRVPSLAHKNIFVILRVVPTAYARPARPAVRVQEGNPGVRRFSKAPKGNGIGATGSKNPRAY